MMKYKSLWMAAATVFGLAGCASSMNVGESKLSCSVAPGLSCTSIGQAWEATENYLPGDPSPGTVKRQAANATTVRAGKVADFLPQPIPNIASINGPKPLLMPAQVLRVWINAYQDSRGNLVYPSRVFAEVTPRRWNVGQSAVAGIDSSRRVSPLVVEPYKTNVDSSVTQAADTVTTPEAGNTGNPGFPTPADLPAGVLPPLK